MNEKNDFSTEKELKPISGMAMLVLDILLFMGAVAFIIFGLMSEGSNKGGAGYFILSCVLLVFASIIPAGLKVVRPAEALVLTLFGKYYGTIKHDGFFFVNPFSSPVGPRGSMLTAAAGSGTVAVPASGKSGSHNISLKTTTLNNDKQKVNDVLGNPVIIGAVVIWKVVNPTKAVFQVDNYKTYLSIQCDSTIRNIARLYPYDASEEEPEEKSLRGSSQEIAEKMKEELQERVTEAGLQVMEVRITHLSYAEEIAAAMLQRQQAVAIIAARKKIVEGAVGMVEMALEQLSENKIVELDDERKAAMVSNLLVVLCGNRDAQPIVNSGSLY